MLDQRTGWPHNDHNSETEKDMTGNLMTINEVADRLKVSSRTVTRWMKDGIIGYVRIPSGRRVAEYQLDEMLAKWNPLEQESKQTVSV